ncbi:peptidase domain-containing ABC transporter [Stenotrophomonas indicatrix]|uniref:peptidase domain-containing ABC transporter n=1 Tax=Stenotrophomonas indicatrix TaxID=2045451 RepID=UPI0028E324F3|nr:peptidase domain-containing ABC transporter [Stenotrophomonas indicatrix]MDT9580885.1 peptidase domain-containing ABC transporter [Stenotrophomonas indicatrix]
MQVANSTAFNPTPGDLLRQWMKRPARIFYQSEANECGLACLAMVLDHHGHRLSLEQLRAFAGSYPQGMSVSDISDVAERKGLVARPLRAEPDELDQLILPAVLHWNMDHFVVLEKVQARKVVILDPSQGRVEISWAALGRHFTGVAIELLKGPDLKKTQGRSSLRLRSLIGPISGLRPALVNLGLLSVALELMALASPQGFQIVIDRVLADGDRALLPVVIVGLSLLALLQLMLGWLRSWAIVWLSSQINIGWSSGVFARLLRLPTQYFQSRSLGDITSRFTSLNTIQQAISTQLVAGILDGVMALATGAMLFVYSPLLGAFTSLTALAYVGVRALYVKRLQHATVSSLTEDARRQSMLLESIRGAQTLKLFGKTGWQSSRFANRSAAAIAASIAVQRTSLSYASWGGVLLSVGRLGALAIGASLVMEGRFTAGMLIAYASYSEQFISRLSALSEYAIQLALLGSHAERVADIALAPVEKEPAEPLSARVQPVEVELRNVCFRYADNQPWVLNNANAIIPAGQMTAITGASGTGKSTIAKLLVGLLTVNSGEILLNGIPLSHLGPTQARRMFGCVMQDDALFQGSLAENIALFQEGAPQQQIEHSAQAACIHDDISRMPMGYRTSVGDMGSTLSGGQRQRIMLARALYQQPQALLLDEATSHLDAETEQSINAHLKQMSLTVIQIAHRFETIDAADCVLRVHPDGSVSRRGKAAAY